MIKPSIIITLLVTLLLTACGGLMSQYEQPKYTVLQSHDGIEIRQYEPKIVAETLVNGERTDAANAAFSILAGYIFGENTPATNIPMTAPVMQTRPGEKISMTVPVTQQAVGQTIEMTAPVMQTGNQTTWVVQFVMPSQYTLATLPKPKNPRITLREVPGHKVAAIRFAGFAGNQTLKEKETQLRNYLSHQGIETQGEAIYAFYEGPFTLPMFKRNEIMIELQDNATRIG
jgi:hypothetical protein